MTLCCKQSHTHPDDRCTQPCIRAQNGTVKDSESNSLNISTLTGGSTSLTRVCVCCPLSLLTVGLSACFCVPIYFTFNKHNLFRWPAPACFHYLSPVCQPTYQAEETIAATAAASNSHLQSPPNHFPHPITQHPHRLLISEPTLREWTGKDWGV